jgi:hypothetical protein
MTTFLNFLGIDVQTVSEALGKPRMIHRKKIKEENKLKKGGRTLSYENWWIQYMVKLHRTSDCFCFGDNINM